MPETGRRGPPAAAHPCPLPGRRCRPAGRLAAASSQRLRGPAPSHFTCKVSGTFRDSGAAEKLGFVSPDNFHPVQNKTKQNKSPTFSFSSILSFASRQALIFFFNLQYEILPLSEVPSLCRQAWTQEVEVYFPGRSTPPFL